MATEAGGGGAGGGTGGSRAPTPGSQFFLDSLARGTPDYLAMMLSGNFGGNFSGGGGTAPSSATAAGAAEAAAGGGGGGASVLAPAEGGGEGGAGDTTLLAAGHGAVLGTGTSAAVTGQASEMAAAASQLYNAVFQVGYGFDYQPPPLMASKCILYNTSAAISN